MKKNPLLIIGLIVVAIAGYFFWQKQPASTPTLSGNQETVSASLAQLMAMGQSYSCTFEATDETVTTSGTVYVAGDGRMNGAFLSTGMGDEPITSYVINDGDYYYNWSSDSMEGFQTKIEADDTASVGDEPEYSGETADDGSSDAAYDFECAPWRVDNSLFVPPSNITFTDISAQMDAMIEQAPVTTLEETGMDCSVCDQAPAGAARSECLLAMGC